MKKIPVLHPFLFAAYPVVFLFSHNICLLSFKDIIGPLVAVLILTAALWITVFFIVRDRHKSGFIVSLFLLLFFSYGHFSRHLPAIFIIWPVLLFAGAAAALKLKTSFKNISSIFNVISAVLIIVALSSLSTIATFNPEYRCAEDPLGDVTDKAAAGGIETNNKELPNIYYIILDAYAGSAILDELYDYDNSEFLRAMKGRGFLIQDSSFSNYNRTFLTVASSLNMEYISSFLGKQLPSIPHAQGQFWGLLRNNRVFRFLKKRGYSIIAFSSGYIDTDFKNADIYLSPRLRLSEFHNTIINTTPIPHYLRLINSNDQFDLHRKHINFIFDNLPKLNKHKKPFFAFAHIMAPHPPFVFGAHGEENDPEDNLNDHDGERLIRKGRLSRSEYCKGYAGQLAYINARTIEAVDSIFSRSKRPPIIIIFGDHGPRSLCTFDNPNKTYMRECMSITKAYYFPQCEECGRYENICPVNMFRVIFNRYFGTHYELLKDEQYYEFTNNKVFRFIKLTEKDLLPSPKR
jgi:hypothetical protein